MTPGDPIPLIPPRLQDAPQLVAPLPISVVLQWSNKVHTHGGIVVNSDGTTEEHVLPPDAVMSPGTSLANWWFSIEQAPGGPHAIRTYIDSLLAATQRFVSPKAKQRGLAGGEDADRLDRRDAKRARVAIAQVVGVAQREQNAALQIAPKIVLFKPVRVGRLWTVVFGERIVCQGVREDTCRHLCRAGNDFLKSLPKQGLVDPIALADQFEQFLVFATAPSSEWFPKLRTNLDVSEA